MSEAPTSERLEFDVSGMHCGSCVAAVEGAVRKAPGVLNASVNLATERATVWMEARSDASVDGVVRSIRAAGYDARPSGTKRRTGEERAQDREKTLRRQRQIVSMAIMYGLPVVALHYLIPVLQSANPGADVWGRMIEGALTLMLFRTAAGPMMAGALRSVLGGSANMDVLVTLGAGTGFISGVIAIATITPELMLFHASAMIIMFVSVGKYFESRSRGQVSAALEMLLSRLPRQALRVVDGRTESVSIDDVRPGDTLRVAAHTAVPVDGTVISGHATIDESMLTGESLPVERSMGEAVFGGTQVQDGLMDVRATAVGEESAAARIARMVEEAQASKPRWQRLADRVASVFVPIVVLLALGTFAVWVWIDSSNMFFAVQRAIAVLVVACPCAMGLAVPTAVLVGTTRAAEHGILVRDAAALEAAGGVREVVLDKTGTLTLGRLTLEALETFDGRDETELLRSATGLEQFSEHPLARALLRAAAERGVQPGDAQEFESSAGGGLRGRVDGVDVVVGNAGWLDENGLATEAGAERADTLAAKGMTVVWIAVSGRLAAICGFSDQIHPQSAEAIRRLRELGVRVRILSGDRHAAVSHVAGLVGVTEFEAELKPADKLERIRELAGRGRGVAMVGDGVNDAPALAAADVGIAIGAGADIARETADICLVGHSPALIADAIRIARIGTRVMKQNLFWALIYNLVMLPVAMATHLPPAAATVAMMISSLSVVGNSLRLRRLI